jgi:hypothetical protein
MSNERTIGEEIADALGNTAPWAINAIRVDERRRIAALLEENAGTIGGFAKDGVNAVKAVAYLIGLEATS